MSSSSFFCSLCHVNLNDQLSLQLHLATAKHRKMLSQVPGISNTSGGNIPYSQDQPMPEGNGSLHCSLCSVSCNSLDVYQTHLAGAKHLKKLRMLEQDQKAQQRTPDVYCHMCDVTLLPGFMPSHLSGMRHLNNLKKAGDVNAEAMIASRKQQVKDLKVAQGTRSSMQPILPSQVSKRAASMRCSTCDIELPNFTVVEQHYNSKSHRTKFKAISRQQTEESLKKKLDSSDYKFCEICNTVVQIQLYESHVNGYKHTLKANGGKIPPDNVYYQKYVKQVEKIQMLNAKKKAASQSVSV